MDRLAFMYERAPHVADTPGEVADFFALAAQQGVSLPTTAAEICPGQASLSEIQHQAEARGYRAAVVFYRRDDK